MTTPAPGKQNGFTIIELMIAVAVLAVLTAVAAPSLTSLVRDQRVKTATFDVYASLAFARSEAIKRNASIDLVTAGTDWAAGWTVQVAGATLKTQDAIQGLAITGPASPVSYQRDGRIVGATAPTFVVTASDSTSTTARCVRVDLSGRPNIKVDTNSNPADGCQ
jgi:type IV fimbrial biogenesis protein FimT